MTTAQSHPIAKTDPNEILVDSQELDTFIHHQMSASKERQRAALYGAAADTTTAAAQQRQQRHQGMCYIQPPYQTKIHRESNIAVLPVEWAIALIKLLAKFTMYAINIGWMEGDGMILFDISIVNAYPLLSSNMKD